MFEYMEIKPTIRLYGGSKISAESLKTHINFKDVKFSYPARADQVVLDNLNLDIPSGKMVALVGTSGSGGYRIFVD